MIPFEQIDASFPADREDPKLLLIFKTFESYDQDTPASHTDKRTIHHCIIALCRASRDKKVRKNCYPVLYGLVLNPRLRLGQMGKACNILLLLHDK